jgi:hypothetical protein
MTSKTTKRRLRSSGSDSRLQRNSRRQSSSISAAGGFESERRMLARVLD